MTDQVDHNSQQANNMPTATNNKSYMNSMESKDHGYPPFLGGISIEIPSLRTPPYSHDTKILHYLDVTEIFHMENSTEIFHVGNSVEILMPENFSLVGSGQNL